MKSIHRRSASIAGRWLAIVLLAAPSAAHEFWIAPESYRPVPGALLAVQLRVGEDGKGEEMQRDEERIRRFVALDASGEKKLVGVDGAAPAGRVRLGEAGVVTLGYHSTPRELVLAADKFEAYLREEGLDAALAERHRLGEQALDGREHYERCAKSLISVGGASGLGATLDLPLEFVALEEAADGIRLELRFEGEPLSDALVRFQPLEEVPEGSASSAKPSTVRSDEHGRVLAPSSGRWLVSAVHMRRAEQDSGADWHSWWASLTYER